MEDNGITPRQSSHTGFCIRDELEKITGDGNFADTQSYKIMSPISYMYTGRAMPHWLSIYNSLTKEQLFNIFIIKLLIILKQKQDKNIHYLNVAKLMIMLMKRIGVLIVLMNNYYFYFLNKHI